MTKFKVGDKVELRPDSQYVGGARQLPLGVVGKIIGYGSSQLWYRVEWGHEENSYQDHDLAVVSTFKGNIK